MNRGPWKEQSMLLTAEPASYIFNGTLTMAFVASLEKITSDLCAYGDTSIYWLLGFGFLHIISLCKYMTLIDRINTMIGKIDSLSKGTRNLPERVQAV